MPEPTVAAFRRATSRYATGIAIVTTVVDGVDHAMTANSFTSVSLDPLLALVCVERDTRFHGAVLAGRIWAVSFLPAGSEATARWFATRGRPLAGQFDHVATHRGANGCLLLDGALAGLELSTDRVIPAGDHDIVLGAVTAIHDPVADPDPDPDPGTSAAPRARGTEPTVYFASRFRHLA
jgi:flavin reductase (DIM6/NTAB) family NADH-FMN oxidoreductase RutF